MTKALNSDDLDLLSAIWILACNDENPLMTYRGLTFRLDLPETFDVRGCIKRHPELFRPGANAKRVDDWKNELREGRGHPGWLKAIKDEAEKAAAIEKLGEGDVFRSQFRARANAEKSPIEIISWGLEHLDRLRKARAEAKDATVKRWEMWLVFGISAVGVITQFALAD